MVFSLFRRREHPAAGDLYAAIVAQARQAHFYERLQVADSVTGRFDMICLHAILLFHRLKAEGEAGQSRAQEVFDTLFRDMDASLREMGVGDVSVPKKVQRMAELFYGSADAYMSALEAEDATALKEALRRNVRRADALGEAEQGDATTAVLADYVQHTWADLQAQGGRDLVAGRVSWIDPRGFTPHENKQSGA